MLVALKTFGCRLNRAESLDLQARLAVAGHQIVDLTRGTVPPDVILVRGCSVTARAQRDCEKEIGRLRRRFPAARIVIGGCLPNAVDLSKAVPLAAPATPQRSARRADPTNATSGRDRTPLRSADPTSATSGRDRTPLRSAVPLVTSRAYLKVQDGCSGKCAFCIVPQFRGRPGSVPFEEVLAQARAYLAAGYHELVVTGCNLALYRSNSKGLPELLAALAKLDAKLGRGGSPSRPPSDVLRTARSAVPTNGTVPIHRVRLGSLEPGICDDRILDVFAENENICRFIHLSLQSGSNAILKRMNRPYPIETVARFREKAFNLLGRGLSLGADVITGFPGETEANFAETLAFVERAPLPFTNLHVFPYSERPGTPAATMDGVLPRAVRLERARTLEARGRALRADFARSFVGQTVEVCVERGGDHGWTSEYLACKLKGPAERRSLVKVVIDRVEDDVLFAR